MKCGVNRGEEDKENTNTTCKKPTREKAQSEKNGAGFRFEKDKSGC